MRPKANPPTPGPCPTYTPGEELDFRRPWPSAAPPQAGSPKAEAGTRSPGPRPRCSPGPRPRCSPQRVPGRRGGRAGVSQVKIPPTRVSRISARRPPVRLCPSPPAWARPRAARLLAETESEDASEAASEAASAAAQQPGVQVPRRRQDQCAETQPDDHRRGPCRHRRQRPASPGLVVAVYSPAAMCSSTARVESSAKSEGGKFSERDNLSGHYALVTVQGLVKSMPSPSLAAHGHHRRKGCRKSRQASQTCQADLPTGSPSQPSQRTIGPGLSSWLRHGPQPQAILGVRLFPMAPWPPRLANRAPRRARLRIQGQ